MFHPGEFQLRDSYPLQIGHEGRNVILTVDPEDLGCGDRELAHFTFIAACTEIQGIIGTILGVEVLGTVTLVSEEYELVTELDHERTFRITSAQPSNSATLPPAETITASLQVFRSCEVRQKIAAWYFQILVWGSSFRICPV